MKIRHALFVPGVSAFFFDDQRAIKRGAVRDGFIYRGHPVTDSFQRIREAGSCLSVLLVLDDGNVALGDCAAVQYSGAGGRDPLFRAERYLPLARRVLRPRLEGAEVESFRIMAGRLDELRCNGRPLHTALLYGVSQALLHARALATGRLMCEVVAEEFGLPPPRRRVPIFGQSGDNRYENADKMILKQVDVLPHGLINNVAEKLGARGEKLKAYIRWLVRRIRQLRPNPAYHPTLHLDVYGTPGLAFDGNLWRVADYLAGLERDAEDFELYIEGPVDLEAKAPQIEALRFLRERLEAYGSRVKIVADEWCNTAEDVREFVDARAGHMVQIKTPDLGGIQHTAESVLYCKAHGIEAYQGGTCNETDVSARACVHVALGTGADRMLAKPGMGFDEGYMIVWNEMNRALAWRRTKNRTRRSVGSTAFRCSRRKGVEIWPGCMSTKANSC